LHTILCLKELNARFKKHNLAESVNANTGMLSNKQILSVQKINALLPQPGRKKMSATICYYCRYINETEYSFCTNCGYPLHDNVLVSAYKKIIRERNTALFKAESSVLVARIVLYIMGAFLSLGIFFIFADGNQKYFIVLLAVLLSGLFFFLAFWSQKNPFTALLTAFVILIVFSAVNIFGKLEQSFTTIAGITGMSLCLALLFVVLKGVQGAYRINLIKQQMQLHI